MSESGARARLPLGTLAFVLAALLVEGWPALGSQVGLDRGAIDGGEHWRLLTGHLLHEVPALAAVDLLAFVLLGAWVERRSRLLWAVAIAASALLSSLAFLWFTHHERYVGSSALVSGLLVAAAVLLLRGSESGGARPIALLVLVLFAGKLALESTGNWPAALGGLPPGYRPVAVAHLAGGVAGGVSALVLPRRARRS